MQGKTGAFFKQDSLTRYDGEREKDENGNVSRWDPWRRRGRSGGCARGILALSRAHALTLSGARAPSAQGATRRPRAATAHLFCTAPIDSLNSPYYRVPPTVPVLGLAIVQ